MLLQEGYTTTCRSSRVYGWWKVQRMDKGIDALCHIRYAEEVKPIITIGIVEREPDHLRNSGAEAQHIRPTNGAG